MRDDRLSSAVYEEVNSIALASTCVLLSSRMVSVAVVVENSVVEIFSSSDIVLLSSLEASLLKSFPLRIY